MIAGTLIAGAAVLGVVTVTGGPPAAETRAERYVAAWARADFPAMHAELSERARRATPLRDFIAAHRAASATATATQLRAGPVGELREGIVDVPVAVRTRVFGSVRQTLRLPFEGEGDGARVAWSRALAFPGLRRGERLERSTQLPRRADILARDGTPLAQGSERSSPLGPVAAAIRGDLGAAPAERAARLRELGYPADATVGVSGLERVFDEQLAGRPGGELRAGRRVLARSEPLPHGPVRTSLDPQVQAAAVQALATSGYLGGVAAVRPRSGEILALAGIAFSGLQPPGSTFKIVTLAGVLDAGLAGPNSTYPVETRTTLEGVEVENANGESCGGTLRYSFAHSCNSVFAPLGARLGPQRLVAAAEAFGFNRDVGIPGAATSTIPPAAEIGDELAVGSSAIGQGRVQATALQMAWVAATIAGRGQRPTLTLERGRVGPRPRVVRASVAALVARYMEAVVGEGTGTAAAIGGVRVAGKTGTAELRDTSTPDCTPTPAVPCPPVEPDDPTDTDAWFAAFAPAASPRVAVGVLLVEAGAGGDTAAPLAREVLLAGLQATR